MAVTLTIYCCNFSFCSVFILFASSSMSSLVIKLCFWLLNGISLLHSSTRLTYTESVVVYFWVFILLTRVFIVGFLDPTRLAGSYFTEVFARGFFLTDMAPGVVCCYLLMTYGGDLLREEPLALRVFSYFAMFLLSKKFIL